MSIEVISLVKNFSHVTNEFAVSDPSPGASYHRRIDSVHSVGYYLQDFSGIIKIQGTLELYPGDQDWVDIPETVLSSTNGQHADPFYIFNFSGNFVWIRAAIRLESGAVAEIRYNI